MMYAKELAEFFQELSVALGTGMETGLAASVDLDSRVIWPPAIAGRALCSISGLLRPPAFSVGLNLRSSRKRRASFLASERTSDGAEPLPAAPI